MQTHRFHDVAGLSMVGGETRYLTADAAEALGHALLSIAHSIRREPFGQAPCLDHRFDTYRAPDEAKRASGPVGRGEPMPLPTPEAVWMDLVQGPEGWRIRQWRTEAFPTGLRYHRQDVQP